MQQTLTSPPRLRDPQPAQETDRLDLATGLPMFSLADSAIADMRDKYLPLLIRDMDDADGFTAVRDARLVVKSHRVQVEKTRVSLKAEALAYGRAVDAEAKRITGLLEPIETHLRSQEENYHQHKAKLKAARLQARLDKLLAVEAQVPVVTVEAMDEAHFDLLVAQKTTEFRERKERERLEAEERQRREAAEAAARKAEEERLAAERAELEAERKRQAEAETQRRREEEERLNAEREKLAAERKALEQQQRLQREDQARIESERRRLDLEESRRLAAEQARRETEERLHREREEAERAAEQKARQEAEDLARAEALRPDREKLLAWVESFGALTLPDVATPEGAGMRDLMAAALVDCEARLRQIVATGEQWSPGEEE